MVNQVSFSASQIKKSSLLVNTAWMYTIQLSAFIFPFLTTPYLARVLAPEQFGQFIYAQTMGQLLSLIIEYGFDLTATRSIATAQTSLQRWMTFYGVQIAKLILSMACVVITWPLFQFDTVIGDDPLVCFGVLLTAVSYGLNLNWLYQGIERLALAGKINFLIRTLSTVSILIFVKSPDDVFLALLIFCLGNIACTLFMYIMTFWIVPDHTFRTENAFSLLKGSFNVFISTFLNQLQLRLITLFIGYFNPGPLVGYFGGAYRLALVIAQVTNPVTVVVYPRIASIVAESKLDAQRLWTIVFLGATSSLSVTSLILIVYSKWIIHVILGPDFAPATPIFSWYVIAIQLVIMNRLLLNLWAMPNHHDLLVRNLYLCASAINIVTGFITSQFIPGVGTVIAICIGEAALMLTTLVLFWKIDIWPFFFPGGLSIVTHLSTMISKHSSKETT